MAQLDPFIKAPGEVLKQTIQCSANIADQGAITSVTATSVNYDTGVDSTATIINSSGFAGTIAFVIMQNGLHGERHVVTVTTNFTAPNKTEDEIFLTIDKGLK